MNALDERYYEIKTRMEKESQELKDIMDNDPFIKWTKRVMITLSITCFIILGVLI